MPTKYKKRRTSSGEEEESDEDYEPNLEDRNNEDFCQQQSKVSPTFLMTSSGRIVRPIKQERIDDEVVAEGSVNNNRRDTTDAEFRKSIQSPALRHLKLHDGDKTFAPDLNRISRYLKTVRETRASSLYQLANEEEQNAEIGKPTLAQFWTKPQPIGESGNAEFDWQLNWRRIDEISPSLTRWLKTQSISLVVHGSVPKDVEVVENGKEVQRTPLPIKIPAKRGRPRKDANAMGQRQLIADSADEESPQKRSLPEKKEPPPLSKKPITTNSRLDQSITMQRPPVPVPSARRTNNSMAVAFSQQPSTSAADVEQWIREADSQRQKSKTVTAPKSTGAASSSASSSSTKFPTLKKVKLEVEDFTLPTDFSTGLGYSATTNNSMALRRTVAAPSASTAQSADIPRPRRNPSPHLSADANQTPSTSMATPVKSEDGRKKGPGRPRKYPLIPIDPTVVVHKQSQPEKKPRIEDHELRHGGVDLPLPEKKQIRLPVFGARLFPFDVDQSPAVQQFESIQLVDLFHSLPKEPNLETENGQIEALIQEKVPVAKQLSMSTIDRLVFRQGKKAHEQAQALFCGGPVAAIAVCPRPLPNGHELFCVATFADETNFDRLADDENAYLQMWTIDASQHSEPAQLAFLLRLPSAQQICSLEWCPLVDNQFFAFKSDVRNKTTMNGSGNANSGESPQGRQDESQNSQMAASTSAAANGIPSNNQEPPLGLISIGTSSGRIHIYSIPSQLDALLAIHRQSEDVEGQSCSTSTSSSQPLVLESSPILTLRHPHIQIPDQIKQDQKPVALFGADANEHEKQPELLPLDAIPLLSLNWSPFAGARHLAAVSATGIVYIWDILGTEPALPIFCLQLERWLAMGVGWMERDKICVTSRQRHLRVYKLNLPVTDQSAASSSTRKSTNSVDTGTSQLLFECDNIKSVGSLCSTQPLLFPGLLAFDSLSFNYFGLPQQSACYIWSALQQDHGHGMASEQVFATNLSNCHQLRIASSQICPLTGVCASVGADGRLVCSLNGRMAPREGIQRTGTTETFLHGRTLLQLISHSKRKSKQSAADEAEEDREDDEEPKFFYSHADSCAERLLEIRLGDCALLDQKNERACGRRTLEVCLGRRLQSLTALDFSRNTVGLTFCGGESGLVFVVPCTL